jgi:hypothetical protein
MSVTEPLPLPSGDQEGLEGFRVVSQTGEHNGVVAAVERMDGALLLIVESRHPRRAYRTVAWSSVKQVDVQERTVCISEDGVRSLRVEQPRAVRRVNADTHGMVRYLLAAEGASTYAHGGTEPSETGTFITILIASLATPAILAAGALATAGNSTAGWIFLAIALALLSGGLLPWQLTRWTARHRGRRPSTDRAAR